MPEMEDNALGDDLEGSGSGRRNIPERLHAEKVDENRQGNDEKVKNRWGDAEKVEDGWGDDAVGRRFPAKAFMGRNSS